jgi:mannosyltransferase OCH1-like enzyme
MKKLYYILIVLIFILFIFTIIVRNKKTIYVNLKFNTCPRKYINYEQRIPKKIYQTMKTNKIPIQMKKAINTWLNLNSEYEYEFYDDIKSREFIKNNFDKQVLMAYDTLKPGAYKADLWRYCILYMYGGVYIDIDTVALLPLRNIIDKDDIFVSARDQNKDAIYNAFIACVPNHPFLYEMIKYVVNNTQNKYYGINPLDPTGPVGFGKIMKRIIGIKGNFSIGRFKINNWDFKLLDFPLNNKYVYYLEKPAFLYKYNDYNKNINEFNLSDNYDQLWKNQLIYN